MTTGFQQQQPLGFSAAVRSTPSPQQAARLDLDGARRKAQVPAEEKSFDPRPKR
jgi:hypothetical protein